MQLGKISAADLRTLLTLYSKIFIEEGEARELLLQKQDSVFSSDAAKPAWCHLYESPAKQHFIEIGLALGLRDELEHIGRSSNQILAMDKVIDVVGKKIDEWDASDEELNEFRENLGIIFALATSAMMSLRSLMTFGYYMNDLIALVRAGGDAGDKALLSAVKIDPTVLGCPSVVARMSRAVMLDDKEFLGAVRRAMTGKLTKREQKNYQQMRVVLQVLHEVDAEQRSQDDLYTLFVEELKLISRERDVDSGSVANNLRQYAYQFQQLKRVSEIASKSLAG